MEIFRDLILREIKELAGIDASQLFDMGLLTLDQARKWLVREKYFQMKKPGKTFTDIKYELSDEYGISVSAIEKLIYRKTG
jgi:hypothetical protein